MRTISNREFAAHPEMYLDMAREQDVRIERGQTVYHLTCEDAYPPQAILTPDDDLQNAITMEELLAGVKEDLREIFAKGKQGKK